MLRPLKWFCGFGLGLLGPGLVLAVLSRWGGDFDGDFEPDTVRIGAVSLHMFGTDGDTAERPRPARPIGQSAYARLQHGLSANDWVFDFLHRDDPDEVAFVRKKALEIVGDAATDQEKAERLLAWMSTHWDRTAEYSTVNAADLLRLNGGMCESAGFVVGILETLHIKAREVCGGRAGQTAVEAWLNGGWRVLRYGATSVENRSMVDILSGEGEEETACIVYYWRDLNGKVLRAKLWYDKPVAPLFVGDRGLDTRQLPDLGRVKLTY